jgi:hypothetical protein
MITYGAYLFSWLCRHFAEKTEHQQQAKRTLQSMESLAYVYFVMNRALWPDQTPLFVDLSTCYKYKDEFPGLFFQQYLVIRSGVLLFDLYSTIACTKPKEPQIQSTCQVFAQSFNLSFGLICLLYFSDQTYIQIVVSTLLLIDQWRLAFGLTSLIMAMFNLNKYILVC